MKKFIQEETLVNAQFPEFSEDNGWKVVYSSEIISALNASTLTIVNELEKEEGKEHYYPEVGAHLIKTKFVRRSTPPPGYVFIEVQKDETRHLLLLKKD